MNRRDRYGYGRVFRRAAIWAALLQAALPAGWSDPQAGQPVVNASAAVGAQGSLVGSQTAVSPWNVSGEYYWGAAGGNGYTRFRDGYWAGNGPAYPSYAALEWQGSGDRRLRLSAGLGNLYLGRDAPFEEPLEAYYKTPLGPATLTAGKFYVPFALQEWEYETKYGMMVQWSAPRWDGALAFTYNTATRRPNLYARSARRAGSATLGLSLAAGTGWTYNSSHRLAWGADISAAGGKWEFLSEYLRGDSEYGGFEFAFGKLTYTGAKRLTPYLGAYHWSDRAGELAHFRSALAGARYALTRHLDVEGGYAATTDKGKWWLQCHWQFGQ